MLSLNEKTLESFATDICKKFLISSVNKASLIKVYDKFKMATVMINGTPFALDINVYYELVKKNFIN